MKIILIGSGGFLGKAIYKGLFKKDTENEWHWLSSSPPSLAATTTHHLLYKWPLQSLADDSFTSIFTNADVIIYAAGAGIQPDANADNATIFNLNLFEPARLVQRLSTSGFKGQLMTFGSYFETGILQHHQPLDEPTFLGQYNPLPNAYCRSKKELSHLHFVQSEIGIPFKWLHLVLTNIYGPEENEKRLIPYIIDTSKRGQSLHFTSGTQIRQYTFVGDVVNTVGGLLGKASGLYHVTNEEVISVKMVIDETVKQIRCRLGVNPDVRFDLTERRDSAMNYLALSSQKLLNDWGICCPTSYREGISYYFN
jgi:nucleoside-diphosphate-sugar epimerase